MNPFQSRFLLSTSIYCQNPHPPPHHHHQHHHHHNHHHHHSHQQITDIIIIYHTILMGLPSHVTTLQDGSNYIVDDYYKGYKWLELLGPARNCSPQLVDKKVGAC